MKSNTKSAVDTHTNTNTHTRTHNKRYGGRDCGCESSAVRDREGGVTGAEQEVWWRTSLALLRLPASQPVSVRGINIYVDEFTCGRRLQQRASVANEAHKMNVKGHNYAYV